MEPLEIEVKFYLEDYEALRNRILSMGAKSRGRVFERNIRFETVDNRLIRQHSLLRLRRADKSTLTFKSEAENPGRQFKIHKELEVGIDDFDAMARILESLGFQPAQCYEKWRETLKLHNTCFCLDALPYGNFIEIEGTKSEIKQWAARIGLDWNKRILLNYLAMFEIIRIREKLAFSDITFLNFTNLNIDPEQYLDRFEIGEA
ncbi:MAG: class IV adenylate cyclase [Thermodesulfobacteriota bacterium]